MPYDGQIAEIPLARIGLLVDDPVKDLPPGSLVTANNISYEYGNLQKDKGSAYWSSVQLLDGATPVNIVAFYEFSPTSYQNYVIVVGSNGKVYKTTGPGQAWVEVTATGSAPATLTLVENQVHLVEGGNELSGNNKKLFIFNGQDPIQVISGTNNTRSNLANPAAEWGVGNYPTFGIIHRGQLFVMGMKGAPHRFYGSRTGANPSHEDFTDSSVISGSIYPGEGDRILCAWIYKGRLFFGKNPQGVYFLVDTDTTATNWYATKLSTNFGVASQHSIAQFRDNIYACNSYGSVSDLQAVFQFGDIAVADLFRQMKIEDYLSEQLSPDGQKDRWILYYEDKKRGYITYRSKTGNSNDRLVVVDVSRDQPKVSISTKDAANCLGFIKDQYRVQRAYYGSTDGYIYNLDAVDRSVNGSGYSSEFWVASSELGVNRNKLFHHLEVEFQATGKWDLTVEVYIDGDYSETINFRLSLGVTLGVNGDSASDTTVFVLGRDRLSPTTSKGRLMPLHGIGQSIGFRCYNNTLRQNFKIDSMKVYFKVAGDQQLSK